MYKMYEMELAGRTLRVDVDRVAKQANGAVLMHYGDTTVLCTSTESIRKRNFNRPSYRPSDAPSFPERLSK